MQIAIKIFFFGSQLAICHATCQQPYMKKRGVCINISANSFPYCEAQAYCSSIDGELIKGGSFMAFVGKSTSGMPSKYWIGLTDMLNERVRSRKDWQWTGGALDPPSQQITWSAPEPGYPNGGVGDCIYKCLTWSQICDVGCLTKKIAVCQPRLTPSLSTRTRIFQSAPIPVGLSAAKYAEKDGCPKVITNVKDSFECAVLCSNEPKDWCASYYFNEAMKECRLMLYTDALVDMGDGEGWVKFEKK